MPRTDLTLDVDLRCRFRCNGRIGFTGTPIIMGAKKRTHEIFGEFIDRYTIKESEADGMTVPILYEGRTARGGVRGGGRLDDLFEDMFIERTPEELEAIKRKYATKGDVLESRNMIKAKARRPKGTIRRTGEVNLHHCQKSVGLRFVG